jgi:hypothetical protein
MNRAKTGLFHALWRHLTDRPARSIALNVI